MAKSRYIVGIDLGTTNSVVSFIDTNLADQDLRSIPVLEIPQVVEQSQVACRNKLPSFLFLPSKHELSEGSLQLPWDSEIQFAVGEFARDRGTMSPGRLVTSAKSWLSHAAVDRTAEILPWGAPEEVERLSPIEVSTRYLIHIKEAWNHVMAEGQDWARLENQEVILTVPASFDEVARELTVEAAKAAGFERLVLIEEPQAAFYAWLFHHRQNWEEQVSKNQLILVCDVGGGTSDFSLIQVEARGEDLGFRRIAVGDHLLLGGDNMDLAIAAQLEERLAGPGKKLNSTQWAALSHSCRLAKESLLAGEAESASVSVPGRSSRLVGGTLRADVNRVQVLETVLSGFFPETGLDELPERAGKSGIQEFGLPYAADPAISKQLAAFLRNPIGQKAGHRRPDLVLFNGGVFKPEILRHRVIALLTSWFPDSGKPGVLEADLDALDMAVSRGAAYYGLVRRGLGVKIAGGTARSFYIGLNVGDGEKTKAVCVAPQGLEEGQEIEVLDMEFELLIRSPVHFPFFSSSTRPLDGVGDLVETKDSGLTALPPIYTVLKSGRRSKAELVRVRLHTILTEVGTLELWCEAAEGDRRWRLQFEVRHDPDQEITAEQTSGDVAEEDVIEESKIEAAAQLLGFTFIPAPGSQSKNLRPENLMKNIEAEWKRSRSSWPPGALRGLWPAHYEQRERRKADAIYEARWLNLAGFLLRPGYGYPMDDWRIKEVWRLFNDGIINKKNMQTCAEYWILWRRIAGGLNKGQQAELLKRMLPMLTSSNSTKRRNPTHEEIELWRAAGSLDRLSPKHKRQLGETLIASIESDPESSFRYWALGRIGARIPFYGPIDTVVSKETVEAWIEKLLTSGAFNTKDAEFALVQLARMSGDRARDIDDELRKTVLDKLKSIKAAKHHLLLVREVAELQADEQAQAFGESLPPALRLITHG
ncbi:MAG: hsp70 family protein [Planctomycetota bacterium]|nr:hsp70 family protein [Planctomycetota bacterium]